MRGNHLFFFDIASDIAERVEMHGTLQIIALLCNFAFCRIKNVHEGPTALIISWFDLSVGGGGEILHILIWTKKFTALTTGDFLFFSVEFKKNNFSRIYANVNGYKVNNVLYFNQ